MENLIEKSFTFLKLYDNIIYMEMIKRLPTKKEKSIFYRFLSKYNDG